MATPDETNASEENSGQADASSKGIDERSSLGSEPEQDAAFDSAKVETESFSSGDGGQSGGGDGVEGVIETAPVLVQGDPLYVEKVWQEAAQVICCKKDSKLGLRIEAGSRKAWTIVLPK